MEYGSSPVEHGIERIRIGPPPRERRAISSRTGPTMHLSWYSSRKK